MNKVLSFLIILVISAAGVSAQGKSTKDGAVVKTVSYRTGSQNRSKAGVVEIGPRSTYLKEGLSLAAVLHVLGAPASITEQTADGKTVMNYEFKRGGGRTLTAQFINDVLVHFQTVEVSDLAPRTAGF
ncbi:MAG TPA: hypothetical protein VN643_25655 [Pyrinomonadaceae bacterium]|nr:hypothetical protein [Pyrinomonadaceae bacterium]